MVVNSDPIACAALRHGILKNQQEKQQLKQVLHPYKYAENSSGLPSHQVS